jgi:hypothetical protein
VSGPSWTIPTPTSALVDASGVARAEETFFGRDIWFDIASPDVQLGEARYVVTPAGDWKPVTGEEALRQSLIRRLITNPGDLAWAPMFGVGAIQYVKARSVPSVRSELEGRIRSQFLADPRVQAVETVMISPLDDGSPGIRILVTVTPKGRLRADKALPIALEVR